MLRIPVGEKSIVASEAPASLRVSSGTAAVLGLRDLRMDTAPTTAYMMLGDRCQRDCAFCTQARSSTADSAALSRVSWPRYAIDEVIPALASSCRDGSIVRACFQVTVSDGYLESTTDAITELSQGAGLPICTAVLPRDIGDVASLLDAGAERVTIALDAACEHVYRRVKTGSWRRTHDLLEGAARAFPGRMGTHLIAGLGESEREIVECTQGMLDLGVMVGLFAFMPVRGARMGSHAAPKIASYRRVQAARWLMTLGHARADEMTFNKEGRLTGYGAATKDLEALLAHGDAFRTAGCSGCNRPYYNERPAGPLYNYPRPLSAGEAECEIAGLLQSLDADTR